MSQLCAKPKVFITDGSYPNSLAAVRCLGRAGILVTVGERETISSTSVVGFWSRYCACRARYPDPTESTERAVVALTRLFEQTSFDAAIPIGLQMTDLFVHYADRLNVPVMLPPMDAFEISIDKSKTFQFAASIGIRIPRTFSGLDHRSASLPCVFKHPRTGVLVAGTARERDDIAARLGKDLAQYIVQEFIPGRNGFGYFGFFVQGTERGFFMHQRLMQYPIEGGPSVEAKSIYEDELHEIGARLLTALQWNGVAMVEFKRSDEDGKLYLMEINPKFWGSLDLAIQAGSDFPLWVFRHIQGHATAVPKFYDLQTTYQSVVPNGLKCCLRYPEYRSTFLRHLLSPRVRKDLLITDPLPALAGLATMARHALRA